MDQPTGQLTVLLKKSENIWDKFWHGEYKDAVIIWEITDLAKRSNAVVFRYHPFAGWLFGPTLHDYKRDIGPHSRVTLQYFGSPEYHTDKLFEMIGRTHFDGTRLSPPKGIARLIGMQNWKKATWESLVSNSKHTI